MDQVVNDVPDAAAVDAVVTWVDAADEEWRAGLRRFAGDTGDPQRSANGPRYRDHDLLRYCLRSLYRNMPWLRHIHLVTAGHLPRWLGKSTERLKSFTHEAIFPDRDCLPVFNSRAIETCLHRIPGLSETFLYFNDDFFVLQPAARSRFVTADGGHIVPLERCPMPIDPGHGHANNRSLAFTQLVLNKTLGANWGRSAIPHVGYPFSRSWIEHLWSTWPDDLARTARHRFCMTDSLSLQALYYHSLLEWPRDALPDGVRGRTYPPRFFEAPGSRFIMTTHGLAGLRRDVAAVDAADTEFLCVNDDTTDPAQAVLEGDFLRAWLEARFPDPAPWESSVPQSPLLPATPTPQARHCRERHDDPFGHLGREL